MKNFTNNFKQFTSRLSARWLIMALMMLVGTSSAWADTRTYNGTEKLYVSDPGDSWWNNDGAYTAAYFYGSNGSAWTNAKQINGVIALDIPAGTWTHVIMVRLEDSTPDWENKISDNQTGDIPLPAAGDYIKDFKKSSTSATWSTYTPPCDPPTLTLTTTTATVNKGGTVNLTTLSGAAASNSGTIEWSTSTTGSPVIDANVTISATTAYYAKAVKDGCKSASKSFEITAACTKDFYLVGQGSFFGSDWTTGQDANKLDCDLNTLTKTYTNKTVAANTKVEYKITGKNGWKDAEYPTNGNASFTIPTAGTYNITFTANTNGTSITGTPTVTWKLSCNTVTKPTITLTSSPVKCGVDVTAGLITIDGYDANTYTYTLNKDGNATTIVYNDGYAITEEGSYTVTADVSENSCGSQTSDPQEVTVTDNTPTINSFTVTAASDKVCKGSSVTLTATHVNGATYAWYKGASTTPISGATAYTYSPTITENTTFKVVVTKTNNECPATAEATSTIQVIEPAAAPTLNPNSATVCGGEAFTLLNIDGVTWSLDGKTTTGRQSSGIANNTDAAIIKTFQAVKEVDGCPSAPADYKVTVNPTPVITGESVAQPGKLNAITLKLQGTLVADWEVSGGDIDKAQGNSILFSAETNDTYTITATTKEGCSATHSVTVKDASYVYVRRPKEGDGTNVYTNWYVNSNVEGGPLYIKSGPITAGNASANNKGGNLMTEAFTDCKGFIWDRYEIAAGQTQFHVHAANEKAKDGYATFSQTGIITDDQDYYFTLSSWTTSQYGVTITETSDPRKPTVYALGSTALGTNKFAALYVTDCSGKEITDYQWYKDGQPYSSVCSYIGKKGAEDSNAGETNNIRPDVAGNYSCTVKYEDGSTATSAAVSVTGTYSRSFTSNIPVLVVNTGNNDFPGCQASGTDNYPSKYADELKAKRSVDVKIYDGEGALVYDRKARMAYRGSSSLNFTKKSYAFCPGKANCGDEDKGADYVKTEKLNMLGVGNAVDKDWVLYAAAADPSLMRNRMVFDTYQAMRNDWGVHSRYVELIVNGDYKGVYVFMDKITMNENRVEVNEDNGFIVKFDKTDCADRVEGYNGIFGDQKTFSTDRTGRYGISTYHTTVDQLFEIEYPEKDDYPTGWANKVASIKGMFQAFEDALEAGDYATVQKYIDYDSWADWFIINEYIKNQDAYRASCIFVYNGEKIEARPLWDQELSMNNTSHKNHNCDDTNSLLITTASIYGDDFPAPFWFTGHDGASIEGGLLKDGCFISLVQKKLADYLKEGAALYAGEDVKDKRGPILKLAHDFNEELVSKTEGQTSAQEREDKFWEGKSRSSAECGGTHSYSQSSYSNEYGNVKNWILGDRDENLTSILGGMSGEMSAGISITTSPANAIVTPWIPITVTVNVSDNAEYIYDDTSITNGIALDVDKAITSKSGNKYTYTFPRPADWGNDNVDAAIQQIVYPITAKLKVYDTVCPGINNETGVYIKLQDEGNDICGELVDQ